MYSVLGRIAAPHLETP